MKVLNMIQIFYAPATDDLISLALNLSSRAGVPIRNSNMSWSYSKDNYSCNNVDENDRKWKI